MLENKVTEVQGVHYTRYIMSWLNAGGSIGDFGREPFTEWLKDNCVTEEERREIRMMCVGGGKLELEQNAKPYIEAQKKWYAEKRAEMKKERFFYDEEN